MPLPAGSRLGPYEVVSALGAGGMGEVYRARDTRLQREVAIKVLPALVADDVERRARFEREAQVLAALNHPHIAQIHGLEESSGVTALVMELVEGPTLADRIAAGPIPLAETLAIATQIADAIETAHDKGIVHRDLKPSNIALTKDGQVKVLDFGLAKLAGPDASAAGRNAPSLSPTITSPVIMATGVGTLLGTAAYMSPEQAKGLPADHRSDVFAFGGVLFEMLSGRQAFAGDTVSDLLASVLAREPQFDLLPKALDTRVVDLLRRCLVKAPRQRWQAMGDVRIELERIAATPFAQTVVPAPRRRRDLVAIAATALAALTIGAAAAMYVRPRSQALETRLDITARSTSQFSSSYALSPDGRAIVFAGSVNDGASQLWLRRFDSTEARPLPGTERGTLPFWSPDGRSVGFFSDATLKRIDLVDQAAQTLATLNYGTGGAWAPDGSILFSPTISSRLVLLQFGKTVALPGQGDHLARQAPAFLPDGQQFLLWVSSPAEARGVYVGARDGRAIRKLLDADSPAGYIDAGWVLFVRRNTLFAQRFDPARAIVSGDPVVIARGVGSFSVARSGVIAYRAAETSEYGRLRWFDRDGTDRGDAVTSTVGSGSNPRIGPDGRIAWDRLTDGNRDVWVFDGTRATRLTSDGAVDFLPAWLPANDRIVFSSNRHGVLDLYEVPIGDPAAVRLVVESPRDKLVTDISPDGHAIAFLQLSDDGGQDIWTMRADDPKSVAPLVATKADERGGQFSPDGRWIAYQSDESGKFEIYVRRFPEEAGSGRQVVSTTGGIWPRWSRDGRELYYVDPAGTIMASATMSDGPELRFAAPVPVLRSKFRTLDPRIHPQYDVDRRSRFLVVSDAGGAPSPPITVILNWTPPAR